MSTTPAPGEGRLSFDSPEIKEFLFVADRYDPKAEEQLGRVAACLRAEHEARVAAEKSSIIWTKGQPPKWVATEWFVARLSDGCPAVLTALPKEHSYDFKTADETYYKKERIREWAQFPSSEFRTPLEEAEKRLAAAESENARIKNALKALVDQLDKVHLSDEYLSVWTIYMAHCGAYTGPRYINELTVAKAALAPAPTAEAAGSDASTDGRTG